MSRIGSEAMTPKAPAGREQHRPEIADAVPGATARFYRDVMPFSGFGGIGDPRSFTRLPDDWTIGLADIVASTEAIEEGRYKTVNTAGAAVISAVSNALGTLDFPFIFGGDGASFAVAGAEAGKAADALARTVAWVGGELGLVLRGGTLSIGAIRAEGLDVRMGRFAVSPSVTYAMFAGGGLAWAEQLLKAGALSLPDAPPGSQPDLTGLSCRFQNIKAKHGLMLSILARPTRGQDDPGFRSVVARLLALAEQSPDAGRPIPVFEPFGGVRPESIRVDGRLQRRPGESRGGSMVRAAGSWAIAAVVLAAGRPIGAFLPKRYLEEVVENSDFRKYDDALMMTLDCTRDTAAQIEALLRDAHAAGVVQYGLHHQDAATVTCVVPSVTQANHVHFIDGASGGYAMAARDLKSRLASESRL